MKPVIIIAIALVLLIPITIFFLLPIDEPIQNTSNEDIMIDETVTEEQVGIVEGTVYFVGKPCPSSRLGPPCDGPYPNYEVIIYENNGKGIVNKVMTDDEGNFEVQLPVGDYVVFGKNMDFNKVIKIPLVFTVEPEKINQIKIKIDTGVR